MGSSKSSITGPVDLSDKKIYNKMALRRSLYLNPSQRFNSRLMNQKRNKFFRLSHKMAKKWVSKQVEGLATTTTKKRIRRVEEQATAAKSPIKNLGAESSDDDEEMATEEEQDSDRSSSHPVVVATMEKQSSDSETEAHVTSARVVKTQGKKGYFQRIWTKEDEILLLQEMVDYKNDDINGFYEIIKKKLSFEAQPSQFKNKISTLKNKYYKGKRNEGVDENSFSNAHDRKCFQLSKVIWGSIKVEEPRDEQSERDWFLNTFLLELVTRYGIHEDVVKQRWSKVSMITKKRLEENLKLVEAKEFDCVLQKIDILREATSAIAEAI